MRFVCILKFEFLRPRFKPKVYLTRFRYVHHNCLLTWEDRIPSIFSPCNTARTLCKKHISSHCRWCDLVPQCQRSVLFSSHPALPTCYAGSFPNTNTSNSIVFARLFDPSSRVACMAALTSCFRPHSEQRDSLVT